MSKRPYKFKVFEALVGCGAFKRRMARSSRHLLSHTPRASTRSAAPAMS